MNLSEKTFLITGATGQVGGALARILGPRCAKVFLTGRRVDVLQEVVEAVRAAGGTCEGIPADLGDVESLRTLAEAAVGGGGSVDVLINNAADVTSKPFTETSLAEIEAIIHANVIGALQLTRLLLPSMLERGAGAIVNISSLAGYKPNPTQTVYAISKAAVNGMSDALRAEVRGTGVHVMNVGLSSVATDAASQGGVPVERFASALEKALEKRQDELFLSPLSKWLMRLYKFLPFLARLS